MIYSVDQNSPAYKANLRETDVIVQIDGKNIRKLKFDKVKQLLSDSQKKGRVEILAIDKEGYKYYKERKKKFSSKKLVTEDNTEPFYTVTTSSGISESDRTRERNLSSDIGIYYLVYLFKSKLIIY
jgi:C-terminal processing protease CtpA/Prc